MKVVLIELVLFFIDPWSKKTKTFSSTNKYTDNNNIQKILDTIWSRDKNEITQAIVLLIYWNQFFEIIREKKKKIELNKTNVDKTRIQTNK